MECSKLTTTKPDKHPTPKPIVEQAPMMSPMADVAVAAQARMDLRAMTPRHIIALQHTVAIMPCVRCCNCNPEP